MREGAGPSLAHVRPDRLDAYTLTCLARLARLIKLGRLGTLRSIDRTRLNGSSRRGGMQFPPVTRFSRRNVSIRHFTIPRVVIPVYYFAMRVLYYSHGSARHV